MRHSHILRTTALVVTLLTQIFGQINLSGFADIRYVSPNAEFHLGQLELDISTKLHSGISFEGAFALNPETNCFEAGTGFIEIALPEQQGRHTARGPFFNHTGFSLGLFDVPFGIDWQHIASPDRLLVTTPLLNEKSINGWNDLGVNFHTDIGKANLVVFLVNGAADGLSIGGRIAYTPSEALGVGLSYFTQSEANGTDSTPQGVGVDLESVLSPLSIRMEIHDTVDLLEGDFSASDSISSHQGYYLQIDWNLFALLKLPIVVIGRYGDWSMISDNEDAQRKTVGIAYSPAKRFEVRAEWLSNTINGKQQDPQLLIQTLVSF